MKNSKSIRIGLVGYPDKYYEGIHFEIHEKIRVECELIIGELNKISESASQEHNIDNPRRTVIVLGGSSQHVNRKTLLSQVVNIFKSEQKRKPLLIGRTIEPISLDSKLSFAFTDNLAKRESTRELRLSSKRVALPDINNANTILKDSIQGPCGKLIHAEKQVNRLVGLRGISCFENQGSVPIRFSCYSINDLIETDLINIHITDENSDFNLDGGAVDCNTVIPKKIGVNLKKNNAKNGCKGSFNVPEDRFNEEMQLMRLIESISDKEILDYLLKRLSESDTEFLNGLRKESEFFDLYVQSISDQLAEGRKEEDILRDELEVSEYLKGKSHITSVKCLRKTIEGRIKESI